jgi:hypothetical protein
MNRGYRRRKNSDVWHFNNRCQHWAVKGGGDAFVEREVKPRSGELCNECRAKSKRDR